MESRKLLAPTTHFVHGSSEMRHEYERWKRDLGSGASEAQKKELSEILTFIEKSEKIVRRISAVHDCIAILSEIYPVIYRRPLEHIKNPVNEHAGKDLFP